MKKRSKTLETAEAEGVERHVSAETLALFQKFINQG